MSECSRGIAGGFRARRELDVRWNRRGDFHALTMRVACCAYVSRFVKKAYAQRDMPQIGINGPDGLDQPGDSVRALRLRS